MRMIGLRRVVHPARVLHTSTAIDYHHGLSKRLQLYSAHRMRSRRTFSRTVGQLIFYGYDTLISLQEQLP
jgi:hypothetical protein